MKKTTPVDKLVAYLVKRPGRSRHEIPAQHQPFVKVAELQGRIVYNGGWHSVTSPAG